MRIEKDPRKNTPYKAYRVYNSKVEVIDNAKCQHYWDCTTLDDGTVKQVCRYCPEIRIVKPRYIKAPAGNALFDGYFDSAINQRNRVKFTKGMNGGVKL